MDEKDKKRLKSIYVGQIVDRVILILVFFFLMLNLGASVFMGLQIRKFSKTIEPAVEARYAARFCLCVKADALAPVYRYV